MDTLSLDLWMLVAAALWCVGLTTPILVGRALSPGGLAWGLSNRDGSFDAPPWLVRAGRAHTNMVENLAPFAVLVLVAHVTGRTNDLTAMAAVSFVGCRVAHGVFYIAGLVPWRTVAHTLSIAALLALTLAMLA